MWKNLIQRRHRPNTKPEPVLLLFIILSNTAIVGNWYIGQLEQVKSLVTDGIEIPVKPDAVYGHLARLALKDKNLVELHGWAFDGKNSKLVDEILFRYGGELIYSGQTERERPDLVNVFGDVALKAGFKFVIPHDLFKDKEIDNSKIRLFAVSNGVASELKYPRGFK
ncbi:MAG: hypothetical protein O6943_06305 [Bacteroidetes bacterium]|nr:hypothetical protein [Bacteroidota bacterium]